MRKDVPPLVQVDKAQKVGLLPVMGSETSVAQ